MDESETRRLDPMEPLEYPEYPDPVPIAPEYTELPMIEQTTMPVKAGNALVWLVVGVFVWLVVLAVAALTWIVVGWVT